MIIYRLSYTEQPGGHQGYQFFDTRRAAIRMVRHQGLSLGGDDSATYDAEAETWRSGQAVEIERLEIACTKRGVLRALNIFASHPANG